MTAVIEVSDLVKQYGDTRALDGASFAVEENSIHGLLGRNGAGKTTTMSILTGRNVPSSGTVRVFGDEPFENASVLERMCFVSESQKYPDDFAPTHAFEAARMFFPNWDQGFCEQLIGDFALPLKRRIKKLSRGQLSAVGVIIALASRAEITVFDEPYLGLDAVARQLFYDRLLEDYSVRPRTIILSSHLIDEVANLLEHVTVLDAGRVLLDDEVEALRNRAWTLTGNTAEVEAAVGERRVLHSESLGGVSAVTVLDELSDGERARLAERGIDVGPVSIQQLIVRMSQAGVSAEPREEMTVR